MLELLYQYGNDTQQNLPMPGRNWKYDPDDYELVEPVILEKENENLAF